MEILFSMTYKAVQTCPLTLKMELDFLFVPNIARLITQSFFINNLPNLFPTLFWVHISEFGLVHEATPVVDEWLPEEVNLATKLPTSKVGFHAGKDIKVVKKLASPKGAGGSILKGTETFLHHQPIVSTS